MLVIRPDTVRDNPPAVMWIHGGGYTSGMKEAVILSRGMDLVRYFGATVFSPGYRLSPKYHYPEAIEECYACLKYIKDHSAELGINKNQIMVGGESAGGGLCASLAILARDRGEINIAYQMPLYPMIDNLDTDSSRDNHGKVWNTKLNHMGWRKYLGENAGENVSPYAAAAREKNLKGLPPCYTYVGTGEPFYSETVEYVRRLNEAGVKAEVDTYDTDFHSFDIYFPRSYNGKTAIKRFREHFGYALTHYFAENI